MAVIDFFDANHNKIGSVPRAMYKRLSQSAAADHRAMDKFAAANPGVESAKIGSYLFKFVNGKSQVVMD
jgi:hypothetical protein